MKLSASNLRDELIRETDGQLADFACHAECDSKQKPKGFAARSNYFCCRASGAIVYLSEIGCWTRVLDAENWDGEGAPEMKGSARRQKTRIKAESIKVRLCRPDFSCNRLGKRGGQIVTSRQEQEKGASKRLITARMLETRRRSLRTQNPGLEPSSVTRLESRATRNSGSSGARQLLARRLGYSRAKQLR